MARPRKAGLTYFYKDVHDWDDYKIIDLVGEYGPIGFAIYDVVLCEIYKNGYYLEIPIEKLASYVIRAIGNRWIREKSFVVKVIRYCADIGLFDNALLSQSVITSTEIQKHYSEVTVRNKADKSKYWLLGGSEKNDSPAAVINTPGKQVFATETSVFATETTVNDADMHQSKENKSKVNKSKVKQSKAEPREPSEAVSAGAAAAAAAQQEVIENSFFGITGRSFTAADAAALSELHDLGAADALILRVMDDVAKRKHSPITSMRYFIPIVREAMQRIDSGRNAAHGLCAATSSIDDVERLLDEEWAKEVAKYDNG